MANKPIEMLRLRKLFQLLSNQVSQRQISKDLKMSRSVMSVYISRVKSCGKSYQELLSLDDAALSILLNCAPCASAPDPRFVALEPGLGYYHSELAKPGVTQQLLWEEYRIKHPDGYGYTQFKEHLQRYGKSITYSFHNHHVAGQEMQVDFAGDHLYITNRQTDEKVPCVVLVCTLPSSGLSYVIALLNAGMEHFFHGLNQSLSYYGGVPLTVKSDNMKQWVKRADRYEPLFNDAATEWGLHYNTTLVAARVAKPRDKGYVKFIVM